MDGASNEIARPRVTLATRVACRVTLALPRWSPLRWLGAARRRRLIAQGARPFTARSFDNAAIDALFFKAHPRGDASPRLPVVLNHGYVETKEMHEHEVQLLRRAGHDVLLYDLRAHGRSGGRITTLGAFEQRDLRYLLDAATNAGLIGGRAIAMGYSTGAATMLQHAADDERIVGVIAQTPFASMTDAVRSFRRKLGGWIAEDQLLRGFAQLAQREGFRMEDSDTIAAIGRMDRPVLLVVGDCDDHLPPEHHCRPLAAAARKDRVDLLVIPGANHVSLYVRNWPKLNEAIINFCARLSAAPEKG